MSTRARAELVRLEPAHIEGLSLRYAGMGPQADAHAVRRRLQAFLETPDWSFAGLLDGRVAGVGGIVWLDKHWCMAGLAPADWVRPMQWRPFLPWFLRALDRAHRQGATRIEASVDAKFLGAHRLVRRLGFEFQGLHTGRDGTSHPWALYAHFATPRDLPAEVAAARDAFEMAMLRAWALRGLHAIEEAA